MPDLTTHHLTIDCGAEQVGVTVEFRERSKLSITVHPDGSVVALAPMGRTLDEVDRHLVRRKVWIVRQLRLFKKYQPLGEKRRYVSGESHLYLGRQYRLRISKSDQSETKLSRGYFNIKHPDPDAPQAVAEALYAWYRDHADSLLHDRVERCLAVAHSIQAIPFTLRIRQMARRWGSCSRNGTLTLNPELVKAPLDCVDYVVMHELCHLRVHDHSPAFFRLLGRYMPDWQARKARLDARAWA